MIHIVNPGTKVKDYINTTSRSRNWSRWLSPFFLGPVELYNYHVATNVENAWQYSKVYAEHIDSDNNPLPEYFEWARNGWSKERADRYPMGKGRKPLYSYWDGEKLTYVQARKKIYCPLYAGAVEKTTAFEFLKEEYKSKGELWLWDFDGYDHRSLDMSYKEVLECDSRKMGHAFVLAMMLENQRVWEKDAYFEG